MRKIFLSVSLSLLFLVSLRPQEIVSAGKFINVFEADNVTWRCHWDFNEEGIKIPFSITQLYGDTTLNGQKWRIVNINKDAKGLVRTENKRVMFKPYPGYERMVHPEYLKLEEAVIYDFSLEIGDSVAPIGLAPFGKVDKIDSVELEDGCKHKRIHIGNYRYIEGFGNEISSPFFMISRAYPTMPSIPTFVCCHVNDKLLYRNPKYSDCNGSGMHNELVVEPKTKLQFSDGRITVSLEDGREFDVAVFNIQGVLIKQQKGNRYKSTISLGTNRSVYFVQIRVGEHVYTHKIASINQ